MKKAILIFISALFICSFVNAQYRINKTKYDFHKYSYHVGDPYNPSVSGLTSFFIPGLGQMLSGEVGRGFGFLSGYLGSMTVSFVGLASFIHNMDTDEVHHKEADIGKAYTGLLIMIFGVIGTVFINLDSIVDAVRVAKVNNLAFRDKNKTSFILQIQPYFNKAFNNPIGSIPTGITLKIKF